MVLGLGTTALAAVPGDPFKLGRLNAVDALTQLVGSTNNALLKIDNDSKGTSATALDLQVDPKKPPMRVNSFARVDKLNADLVDGRSADQFANGIGGTAVDADNLDGRDSTEIGINGYEFVRKTSVSDSSTRKVLSASCPQGKRIIGGGGSVFPTLTDPNRLNAPIALRTNGVNLNGFDSWDVEAVEVNPYEPTWVIFAMAVCADVGNP